MKATWWSGMAEGQALSVFSRLYAIEGRQADLDVARTLFAAMLPHGTTGAWVTARRQRRLSLDPGVPAERPGLHAQRLRLRAVRALRLLPGDRVTRPRGSSSLGGLTTVRHYLPQFRNPGEVSFYCLSHHVTNQGYHDIHVAQLKMLAKMTKAWDFVRYARLLDADA